MTDTSKEAINRAVSSLRRNDRLLSAGMIEALAAERDAATERAAALEGALRIIKTCDLSDLPGDVVAVIDSALSAAPATANDPLTVAPSQTTADVHPDTKRLDLIQNEFLRLDPIDLPTGGGDADVGWTVSQYHQGEEAPRVLVRFYEDDARGALDAAQRYFNHEAEPENSPADRLDLRGEG